MDPLYALPSLLPSGFTSDFRFYDYYYISYSYPVLLTMFHSISLLLLPCHTMSTSCLISLVLCLLAPACLCSRHCFQCMTMIRFYRYTCAYLCSPLGICITTRLGSSIWLPWILMSRFWSLERVDSPSCWSEWRSGSMDLQQTVQGSILPGPPVRLQSFPVVTRSLPLVLFIHVHLFVFSQLRISVM